MPVTNTCNSVLPANAAHVATAKLMFNSTEVIDSGYPHIQELLDLDDENGCMIILTSADRWDKALALSLIIHELCERFSSEPVSITHAGRVDFIYPTNSWHNNVDRLVLGDLTALDKGFGQVVVIDEVRTYEDAQVATLLAQRGHKVIFTHGAASCERAIADLSNMLCVTRYTETVTLDTVLQQLCQKGRVRAVHLN